LPEKELLRCGEALSVLRPHVQPSANNIVRYRRGIKDKKLTGLLDNTAKNPVQRFNAASAGIARLLSSRASIPKLRSALENTIGELAPASAVPTRVQLQEEFNTEMRRRETVERTTRRLKEKLARAKNISKEEAQAQIRAAAKKMAARLALAKVKKAEKEADKENKKAAKSVAAADKALIDGLTKAGEKTAEARKRARDMEGKAGKSEKRFRDLQEMRKATEQLRDETSRCAVPSPAPARHARALQS
jgi:chemotaxis protein histidine kinase CheA